MDASNLFELSVAYGGCSVALMLSGKTSVANLKMIQCGYYGMDRVVLYQMVYA